MGTHEHDASVVKFDGPGGASVELIRALLALRNFYYAANDYRFEVHRRAYVVPTHRELALGDACEMARRLFEAYPLDSAVGDRESSATGTEVA